MEALQQSCAEPGYAYPPCLPKGELFPSVITWQEYFHYPQEKFDILRSKLSTLTDALCEEDMNRSEKCQTMASDPQSRLLRVASANLKIDKDVTWRPPRCIFCQRNLICQGLLGLVAFFNHIFPDTHFHSQNL
jgi:hypothetical protein